MKSIPWCATLPCVLALHAVAQSGKAVSVTVPLTPSTQTYAAESAVILHRDTVYREAADGTGSEQVTVAVKVQAESSVKALGVVSVAYAANSQHVELAYVRVRHPDGTLSNSPVEDAIELSSPITQQAPFYSDQKIMQLPVRSLKIGDTLEWQATIVRTKAEAPNQFWGQESFSSDIVVLSQTLELHVPKDSYVNVWSPTRKPLETTTATDHVFRWENSQLKPLVGKEADAEREAKKKKVWTAEEELAATDGALPDVAWTSFKNWGEVGDWYRGLEEQRMQPDDEIKAKVAQLTAGKTSEEAKVRAVYAYVSSQIRYIGVAFGIGRYQPHTASVVLENQYGDCKDKHTLLASMLIALGLHPDAVLIGAGIRFNEAVPSPAVFNHLITRVNVDGKPVWLDSTTEVAPYQMLVYGIRGHQALVVPESGPALLARTPADPPFPFFQKMDAIGSLDKEGTSNSRLTLTVRGDDELGVRAVLRQIGPAQYDQFAQQIAQGLGYAGTTSHAEFKGQDDTDQPLTVSFDYKRDKAGDWPNRRIIPQVSPVLLFRPILADPPVQTISLGVRRVETSTSAMKLPDGWGAELPEAVHQKSAYATYDETYRFEKGTVYATRRIEVLQEKVPVSEWKAYSKWAEAVDLGNENYIRLTHTGSDSGALSEETGSAPKALDPATLLASAVEDIHNNFPVAARYLLDQIKDLDEKYPHLWSTYGILESRQNLDTAIEDFHKELKLHPADPAPYSDLVGALIRSNQDVEAEEELTRWTALDHDNPVPPANLMALYMKHDEPKKALEAGRSAATLLPAEKQRNPTFQLMLGKAQLAGGAQKEGEATILALMNSTEDPRMVNDCAFELADLGLDLTLTETKVRSALATMEDRSRDWTLDGNLASLLKDTRSIEAAWDTLGWILFREGNPTAGGPYISAAWRATESVVIGEHLGALAQSRKDNDAALTDYELAIAAINGYGPSSTHEAPGPEEKKLVSLTEALRKAGGHSSVRDPKTDLQALRRFPAGIPTGWNGKAEYRLMMSKGKVVKAQATVNNVAGGLEHIRNADVSALFPPGSHATLIRKGMLDCHMTACELILEP